MVVGVKGTLSAEKKKKKTKTKKQENKTAKKKQTNFLEQLIKFATCWFLYKSLFFNKRV